LLFLLLLDLSDGLSNGLFALSLFVVAAGNGQHCRRGHREDDQWRGEDAYPSRDSVSGAALVHVVLLTDCFEATD